jgi:hypothetical protein
VKKFLFVFLLILSIAVESQVKIQSLDYKRGEDSRLSFPYVLSANKDVEKRINALLQNELLENEFATANPKIVFKNSEFVHNDSAWQSGYTEMAYHVEVNKSRLLSLSFEFETMAAYPESYSRYYNFDLQTGELVDVKKIFTTTGIDWIKKTLISEREKRINDVIRDIRTTYEEYAEDSIFVHETFLECNGQADEKQIFIKAKSIVFHKGYCFPHVARNLDIDMDVEWSFKKLEKYFTAYARSILFTQKKTIKK